MGITAMMRVKNEAQFLFASVLSIVDYVDEIVLVDNLSTDGTDRIIATLVSDYPDKIRAYEYRHEVGRVGKENKELVISDPTSPRILANYYNWCLGKCTQEYVMKWDGDMIATEEFGEELRTYLERHASRRPIASFMGGNVHHNYKNLIGISDTKSFDEEVEQLGLYKQPLANWLKSYTFKEPRIFSREGAVYDNSLWWNESLNHPVIEKDEKGHTHIKREDHYIMNIVAYAHMKYCKENPKENMSEDFQIIYKYLGKGEEIPESIKHVFEKYNFVPSTEPAGISVAVLNWNRKDLLEKTLPSVIKSAEQAGITCEVMLFDNGSSDGSVEFVQERFPNIRCVGVKNNIGFPCGANMAIRAARHDYVLLLTNDMMLEPKSIKRMLRGFRYFKNVFCIGPIKYYWDRRTPFQHRLRSTVKYGDITFHSANTSLKEFYEVYFVGGCAMLFDREKFEEIDGFLGIYHPAYWEDIDICERARRLGWKNYECSSAEAYHKYEEKAYENDMLSYLRKRNKTIFKFLYFDSDQARVNIKLRILLELVLYTALGKFNMSRAIVDAYRIYKNREKGRYKRPSVGDEEFLDYSSSSSENR